MTKEQLLDIIQHHTWNTQGFNGVPLYLLSAATESGWMVQKEFGEGYTHFFYLFFNGRAYMYYDESNWELICHAFYRKIKGERQLLDLEARWKTTYERSIRNSEYVLASLGDTPTDCLIELSASLCRRIADAVNFAHAIEGITFGSERSLRHLMESRGQFNELDFTTLCSPVYPSWLSEVQAELWNIKSMQGSQRDGAVSRFIECYSWVENTYLGAKCFTPDDILHRAEGITQQPEFSGYETLKSRKEVLMQTLEFSQEERFLIDSIEICFRWQDERKKAILQSIEVIDPVLSLVAERVSIPLDRLRFCQPSEIATVYLNDPVFAKELKNRRQGSAFYTMPSTSHIWTGDDFHFLADHLSVPLNNGVSELKGVVASPGLVTGIARVCESVSDIAKVQPGEILIASMTRPEYLPAMQKAAGFVTDEGGITCHAAIVARELKKPCIIGTKIATKILKDGDLVEVDADNGIVKIIH